MTVQILSEWVEGPARPAELVALLLRRPGRQTKAGIARELGVSQTSVQNWSRNSTGMSRPVRKLVAQALGALAQASGASGSTSLPQA